LKQQLEKPSLKKRPRRPFSVTMLAVGVLTIAGVHLIRLFQAINNWGFLAELPGVSPLYLALTGFFWAAAGFPLGLALLLGLAAAPAAARLLAAVYTIYYWSNRLIAAFTAGSIQASGTAWGFAIILTVLFLGSVLWILSRPNVKAYFRRDR
jgi:hypothetical protein